MMEQKNQSLCWCLFTCFLKQNERRGKGNSLNPCSIITYNLDRTSKQNNQKQSIKQYPFLLFLEHMQSERSLFCDETDDVLLPQCHQSLQSSIMKKKHKSFVPVFRRTVFVSFPFFLVTKKPKPFFLSLFFFVPLSVFFFLLKSV